MPRGGLQLYFQEKKGSRVGCEPQNFFFAPGPWVVLVAYTRSKMTRGHDLALRNRTERAVAQPAH